VLLAAYLQVNRIRADVFVPAWVASLPACLLSAYLSFWFEASCSPFAVADMGAALDPAQQHGPLH
jgi:hypothetical protein